MKESLKLWSSGVCPIDMKKQIFDVTEEHENDVAFVERVSRYIGAAVDIDTPRTPSSFMEASYDE